MRVSLDPKLLYNLHFIFESGSLSAAAEIPAVSQPTLSCAVSQLAIGLSLAGLSCLVLVRFSRWRLSE